MLICLLLFPRGFRLDRQCVNPLPGDIAQRAVDHPLPFQPGHAGKGGTFDLYSEMRCAAAIIAAVAVVLGAVVYYSKAAGREGGVKNLFDFVCNGASHIFTSS